MEISRATLFQILTLAAEAREDGHLAMHGALIEAARELRRRLTLSFQTLP